MLFFEPIEIFFLTFVLYILQFQFLRFNAFLWTYWNFFFDFVLYILQFQFLRFNAFLWTYWNFFFDLPHFPSFPSCFSPFHLYFSHFLSFSPLFQSFRVSFSPFSPLSQSFRVIFLGIWVQIRSNPLILLDFRFPNHPNSVISGHFLSFLLSILTPKPYITIFQLANRHKKTIFSGFGLKIITRNSHLKA